MGTVECRNISRTARQRQENKPEDQEIKGKVAMIQLTLLGT